MGWHLQTVPGQEPVRVSHNPRLADTHPEIAAQWHPRLNGTRNPQNVTGLSTYKAWWLCDFGHEWTRQVNRRAIHNSGCPDCELKSDSLAVRHPELLKQWSKKNGDLDPRKVRSKAGELVWWTCPVADHNDYQRTVINRTNSVKPLGCPICEGKRYEKSESFGGQFPELAKQWHPKLNGELSPFDFAPQSQITIWWSCPQDKEHEWPAPISLRTRNSECPYCRLWFVTDENRLSTCFPEIADEWHPKKNRFLWPRIEGSYKMASNLRLPGHLKEHNRRLRPSDVAINCDESFWWKCKANGHQWQASVEARTRRGRNCPECDRLKMINEESLAALMPAVAKLWHPTRNLPLTPTDVVPGSTKMVHWRCPKSATHVWQAPVYSVVRSWKDGSNGCRWCSGLSADEKNSLQSKYPIVAKLWHPTKNGELLPAQVTAKSNKKVWWHCGKFKHEYEVTVCNMVASFERGSNGCKFCAGRALAPDNCLKRICPEVAKMWHPTKNGELTPNDLTRAFNKLVFWRCEHGHDWQARVSPMLQSFDRKSAAKGCPFCNGKKASSDDNLWIKVPDAAKLWDSERNAPTRPCEVTPKSGKKFYWRCEKKHSWQTSVYDLVKSIALYGGRCPKCSQLERSQARL